MVSSRGHDKRVLSIVVDVMCITIKVESSNGNTFTYHFWRSI